MVTVTLCPQQAEQGHHWGKMYSNVILVDHHRTITKTELKFLQEMLNSICSDFFVNDGNSASLDKGLL